MVEGPAPDVSAFTATVRGDAAAPQLVPASGAPVAMADASSGIKTGDVGGALGAYNSVLKSDPTDVEALNAIGRYAVAANDAPKLNAVVARLGSSPAAAVHPPDLLLATGRLDQAVEKYYEVEQ